MFFYFFAGFSIGAFVVWLLYLTIRRRLMLVDEELQLLSQEKQIVVEFMHNLAGSIGEQINRHELFKKIVHAAILSTGAVSACVFEKTHENILHKVATEGLFPPLKQIPDDLKNSIKTRTQKIENILKLEEYHLNEGIVGTVAKTGEAVLLKDALEDPRVYQNGDIALTVKSIIVAPILFKKEVLGVLAVANPLDGNAFTENDFSLVQSLGEQAGMAIHTSDTMLIQIEQNKIDMDLALASNIQGMLLPASFPEEKNVDIDALYQPAQKVGGDLYDVFSLDDGRIGIAIADVSGKGIPASLLMAICQTNLRHYAHQYESPANVLKAINKEMIKKMRKDMFITVIYAIVDINKNKITLARAGHELPLILSTNLNGEKSVHPIESEGMALGMVPNDIFDEVIKDTRLSFNTGDILVFYTDGITEATNSYGAEFSTDRLSQAVEDFSTQPSTKLNEGIISRVKKFASEQGIIDDLTLVSIKRL